MTSKQIFSVICLGHLHTLRIPSSSLLTWKLAILHGPVAFRILSTKAVQILFYEKLMMQLECPIHIRQHCIYDLGFILFELEGANIHTSHGNLFLQPLETCFLRFYQTFLSNLGIRSWKHAFKRKQKKTRFSGWWISCPPAIMALVQHEFRTQWNCSGSFKFDTWNAQMRCTSNHNKLPATTELCVLMARYLLPIHKMSAGWKLPFLDRGQSLDLQA